MEEYCKIKPNNNIIYSEKIDSLLEKLYNIIKESNLNDSEFNYIANSIKDWKYTDRN